MIHSLGMAVNSVGPTPLNSSHLSVEHKEPCMATSMLFILLLDKVQGLFLIMDYF